MITLHSYPIKKLVHLSGVIGLSLTLSACGNNPNEGAGARAALGVAKDLSTQLLNLGGTNAAPAAAPSNPAQLVDEAMGATDGKVMIAILESRNVMAIMGVAQTNQGYETWEAADRRSLILKNGILTGSRGLGDDLMASESDASIALITSRSEGQATRSYQFLSGMGVTNHFEIECQIVKGSTERVEAGEINVEAVTLAEVCEKDAVEINNLYWVDSRGNIVKSRQWVSAQVGYAMFQHLRL